MFYVPGHRERQKRIGFIDPANESIKKIGFTDRAAQNIKNKTLVYRPGHKQSKTNIGSALTGIIEVGSQFDSAVNNNDTLVDEWLEYEEDEEDGDVSIGLINATLDTFYDRYDEIGSIQSLNVV